MHLSDCRQYSFRDGMGLQFFYPLAFYLKVKLFLAEWTQRTVGELLSPARLRQELSSACPLLPQESRPFRQKQMSTSHLFWVIISDSTSIVSCNRFNDTDMLTQYTSNYRKQLEIVILDELVPENHLIRKVDATIDFSFIILFSWGCLFRGKRLPQYQCCCPH